MSNLHATCVAIGRRGILIRGPSGSGKSTLALQLIESGGFGLPAAKLVADDQVLVQRKGPALVASAPEALSGLIELRGLGLLRLPRKKSVILTLVVDLLPETEVPRLPESRDLQAVVSELRLARLPLAARNPAGATLVRAALNSFFSGAE